MKTHLMRWMFKFCKFPECSTRNFAVHKTLDVIEDCVICHWAFDDIEIMWFCEAALSDKVEPFLCHSLEFQNMKFVIWRIVVFIYDSRTREAYSPTHCLCFEKGAVKTIIKIFVESSNPDFGVFNNLLTAVVNRGHKL